jgi:putative thiamine transport system ATP-binding protein
VTAGLALEGLEIRRAGARLVAVTATIAPGEIVTVMGPSGSGKSTLLAAILGALDPAFAASGRVTLDGRDLTGLAPQDRRIGMLFQDELLFPHLSVGGNLAFGLTPRLRGRAARRARIEAALAEAGLDGLADRDPATLSGGQRARVALLRTLLSEPRALLLDEPFSRLDAATRVAFRETVFGVARRAGLPTLLVTHDPDDAAAAGGRTLAPLPPGG